jgi:hypothetical protein
LVYDVDSEISLKGKTMALNDSKIEELQQYVLPNFLIAGAAKSGTTSLYYYLKDHPDIYLSPVKEPCFFTSEILNICRQGVDDDKKFYIKTFEKYCELFRGAPGKKAIGEASTDTLYHYEETIPAIKRLMVEPSIIILLRNPVDRAFSAYLHLVRDNRESLSFEQGLAAEEERIKRNWQCIWHYKKRGLYYDQVKAFMDSFKHVKVLLHDDLKKNPESVIKEVYEFLGVDASYRPADTKTHYNMSGVPRFKCLNNIFLMKNIVQRTIRNIGSFLLTEDRWVKLRDTLRGKLLVKIEMKPETRFYLQQFFREDILKLQELIDKDLSAWIKRKI